MPELPEVETVRRGLAASVPAAQIVSAQVRHPRVVRRQAGGAQYFRNALAGCRITSVQRRGKFLWLELAGGGCEGAALVAHLGMSGQFRVTDKQRIHDSHARAALRLADGRTLVFRDQRTFGWLLVSDISDNGVPEVVEHIGRDPFDPEYDLELVAAKLAASHSGIKRQLLGQTVVSGVGNIYADEALWRARVYPETSGVALGVSGCTEVLQQAKAVMTAALAAGGTSFDPLYVAVNGESGWFERSLDVYGREGEPCRRCGAAILRERFTNRSSHRCPNCQKDPHAVASSANALQVAQ